MGDQRYVMAGIVQWACVSDNVYIGALVASTYCVRVRYTPQPVLDVPKLLIVAALSTAAIVPLWLLVFGDSQIALQEVGLPQVSPMAPLRFYPGRSSGGLQ
jgi:hypothetical protein